MHRHLAVLTGALLVAAGCSCGDEIPPPTPDAGSIDTPDAGRNDTPDGGNTSDGGLDDGIACKTIGSAGGTLTLDGLTLTVPEGAVTEDDEFCLRVTDEPVPAGYQGFSPVYQLEPTDRTFDKPLTVEIPFAGSPFAAMFWSEHDEEGWGRLGGIETTGFITERVTHLGKGFVANGVDYTEPFDRSCTVTRLLDGRTGRPAASSVAMLFTVDDCRGRPVRGLDCPAQGCDFVLREDGTQVDVPATLLPLDGMFLFASLVFDVSSSTTARLPELVAGAKAFLTRLSATGAPPAFVSIQLFAGEANITEWQAPTRDLAKLNERLDALASFTPADATKANVNGAIVAVLDRITAAQGAFLERSNGGAFTAGHVVLFTDGADTAGLVEAAVAQAAVAASKNGVFAVALEGTELDDAAESALRALAPNGLLVSELPVSLDRELARTAAQIAGQASRTYLLGYCSGLLSGDHTVTVGIAGSNTRTSASHAFSAAAFEAGCSIASFTDRCSDAAIECGGLGCGVCDDAFGTCVGTSCVSFCDQLDQCGTFTNPLGYAQTCVDVPTSTSCEAQCRNLMTDVDHCGACGNACAAGGVCNDGECACEGAEVACDGACTDVFSDAAHCGECGNACDAGMACVGGVCEVDYEWSRWAAPPDRPSAFTYDNWIVTDAVTGLVWQRHAVTMPQNLNWADALTYCADLTLGGRSDWRLPTYIEFDSIVDDLDVAGWEDNHPAFPNITGFTFWTSTPKAVCDGCDPGLVWAVGGGVGLGAFQTDTKMVRCVR